MILRVLAHLQGRTDISDSHPVCTSTRIAGGDQTVIIKFKARKAAGTRPKKRGQMTTTYEYLNLLASYGGLGLLYYGIRVMAKGAEMRATDSDQAYRNMTESDRRHAEAMTESDRRHAEAMAESERRHNEFMADSRRREEESLRRHDEFMAESRRREEEGIRRHEESMVSLRELIERTR